MVSVCIALYNGEKCIVKQIESVLHQLNNDDEIIISDDGSKDNSLKIIEALNDRRIKVLLNKSKKGPVGNFENALNFASGDIIFLCDQDDVWFDNKIQSHLKEHAYNDLVVSDAKVVDENGNIIFESFFRERKSGKGLLKNLLKNSYIGCCMSFNRKVLEKALPFPANIHMHDWWIGLVAELTYKASFIDTPLMYYIRHKNNASGTLTHTLPFAQQFKNRVGLLKSLIQLVLENGRN